MAILAVDFGTSNTLAAYIDGTGVLKFVDFWEGEHSTSTVLYFPSKQRAGPKRYLIGTAAIREYLEEGGRLLFSIKSLLGESSFDSTAIMGFGALSAAKLCGYFLAKVKLLAEEQFKETFEGVVLGRPADFSKEAIKDLRDAAHFAGFKKVIFVPEPVAAGIKYFETSSGAEEIVAVWDIGGGTADFAVLQGSNRKAKALATGGVHQAGNALSSAIAYHHLAAHLGKNATWGFKGFPIPSHYFEALKHWKHLQFLRKEKMGEMLADCSQPIEFGRFVKLVSHNLGWNFYQAVNAGKADLSSSPKTAINFSSLDLDVPLLLTEFEQYAESVLWDILGRALGTLEQSGAVEKDISAVILTGGSSKVPAIQAMAKDVFPRSRFVLADPFSSVIGGLALVAKRLNTIKQKRQLLDE